MLVGWQRCCIYVFVPLPGLAAFLSQWIHGSSFGWRSYLGDRKPWWITGKWVILLKWWLFDRHVSHPKQGFFHAFGFALNTFPMSHCFEQMQDYTCACFAHSADFLNYTGYTLSTTEIPKCWVEKKPFMLMFSFIHVVQHVADSCHGSFNNETFYADRQRLNMCVTNRKCVVTHMLHLIFSTSLISLIWLSLRYTLTGLHPRPVPVCHSDIDRRLVQGIAQLQMSDCPCCLLIRDTDFLKEILNQVHLFWKKKVKYKQKCKYKPGLVDMINKMAAICAVSVCHNSSFVLLCSTTFSQRTVDICCLVITSLMPLKHIWHYLIVQNDFSFSFWHDLQIYSNNQFEKAYA